MAVIDLVSDCKASLLSILYHLIKYTYLASSCFDLSCCCWLQGKSFIHLIPSSLLIRMHAWCKFETWSCRHIRVVDDWLTRGRHLGSLIGIGVISGGSRVHEDVGGGRMGCACVHWNKCGCVYDGVPGCVDGGRRAYVLGVRNPIFWPFFLLFVLLGLDLLLDRR